MLRSAGGIEYDLTYKRIKNVNMRIGADNRIRVSAPFGVGFDFIDSFVLSRRGFIERALETNSRRLPAAEPEVSGAEIRRRLYEIYREQYKKFSAYGFPLPSLKVRDMKSQWGNCRRELGVITLNKRLYSLPRRLIELVAAHELAHMVEPNHSAAFYAVLSSVMPDRRERDEELKRYSII